MDIINDDSQFSNGSSVQETDGLVTYPTKSEYQSAQEGCSVPLTSHEAMQVNDGVEEEEDAADARDSLKTDTVTPDQTDQFQMELSGLPKQFGFGELKKMLLGMQLEVTKVKQVARKMDRYSVAFTDEFSKKKALAVLNGYKWKGNVLSTSNKMTVVAPAVKGIEKTPIPGSYVCSSEDMEDLPAAELIAKSVTPYYKMPYEEQLAKKEEAASKILDKIGSEIALVNPDLIKFVNWQKLRRKDMVCEMDPIVPSPLLDGYMNMCEFTIGISEKEDKQVTVGHRVHSDDCSATTVGPVDDLVTLNATTKAIVKEFETFLRGSDHAPFDPETKEGVWKELVVRTTNNNDCLLAVIIHPQQMELDEILRIKGGLVEFCSTAQTRVSSIYCVTYQEPSTDGTTELEEYEHLWGETHITETVLGKSFRVSAQAFFQVNTAAAEKLCEVVSQLTEIDGTNVLLDLCCGTGAMGISLAENAYKLYGMELSEQLVEDARYNAAVNGITNAEYVVGNCDTTMPAVFSSFKGLQVKAVLEPPASGISGAVIGSLRRHEEVSTVVYIASDPSQVHSNYQSLARPYSKQFKGECFIPVRAVAVDMFPHTPKFHLVVIFERYDESKWRRIMDGNPRPRDEAYFKRIPELPLRAANYIKEWEESKTGREETKGITTSSLKSRSKFQTRGINRDGLRADKGYNEFDNYARHIARQKRTNFGAFGISKTFDGGNATANRIVSNFSGKQSQDGTGNASLGIVPGMGLMGDNPADSVSVMFGAGIVPPPAVVQPTPTIQSAAAIVLSGGSGYRNVGAAAGIGLMGDCPVQSLPVAPIKPLGVGTGYRNVVTGGTGVDSGMMGTGLMGHSPMDAVNNSKSGGDGDNDADSEDDGAFGPPERGGAFGPELGGAFGPEMGGAFGPEKGGAFGPQMGGPFGPERGGAFGPQRGGAFGPEKGGAFGPQRGGAFGPERGGAFGPERGGAFGPQRGNAFGPERGSAFGPERGNAFGPERGNAFGPERGNAFGPERGNAFGPERGNAFGPQRGNAFGPERGNAFGPERGNAFGPERGNAFGPERGNAFGPERGNAFGPERGNAFGPERGNAFGPERGSAFGPERGSAFGPERGSAFGPERGNAFGPQRGKTFGPERGGAFGRDRSGPFGQKRGGNAVGSKRSGASSASSFDRGNSAAGGGGAGGGGGGEGMNIPSTVNNAGRSSFGGTDPYSAAMAGYLAGFKDAKKMTNTDSKMECGGDEEYYGNDNYNAGTYPTKRTAQVSAFGGGNEVKKAGANSDAYGGGYGGNSGGYGGNDGGTAGSYGGNDGGYGGNNEGYATNSGGYGGNTGGNSAGYGGASGVNNAGYAASSGGYGSSSGAYGGNTAGSSGGYGDYTNTWN